MPRFQLYLDAYEAEHLPARNYAADTRAMYAAEVRFLLVFVDGLGLRDLKLVGRRHVESYLARLDREGYADTTRRRKLSVVKSFFSWLKLTKIIAEDPTRDIIPPRLQWKRPRVLTKEEYRQLLRAVDDPRDLALMQLLLQTGIRLAEAHRLNLADVDLPETIDEQSVGQLLIHGRLADSQTVYLNAAACQVLSTWIKLRPQVIGENALFISRNQDRLSRRQMQRLMGKYVEVRG